MAPHISAPRSGAVLPPAPATLQRNWVLTRFGNLKTAQKFLAGMLVMVAVAAGIGLYSLRQLGAENQRAQSTYNDVLHPIAELGQVGVLLQESRRLMYAHGLSRGADKAKIDGQFAETDQALDQEWKSYTSSDMTGREKLAGDFGNDLAAWRQQRDSTVLPASRTNDLDQFHTAYTQAAALAQNALNELNALRHYEESVAADGLRAAQADYSHTKWIVVTLLVLAVAVGLGLAWLIGRVVSRPLGRAVQVMQALAQGKLTERMQHQSTDETGQIAVALNAVGEKVAQAMREIDASASSLAQSSQKLSATSVQLSGSANRSASQAGSVAGLAEVVSSNVSTVAAGSEEMGVSIREIASNANEAAQVASRAVNVADATNATVSKLGESSREIGNVIKVITSIAEQTNLLALNATIEAARAGEAGKGFAVVANEVKDLAQETAKATEDIARRVEAIQADTGGAVEAIEQISLIIGQINDFQTTIASAVEEQTATTNEMSRNVAEAANGSGEIAATIASMAGDAQETTAGANHTANAANDLSAMANQLKQVVQQFQV